MLCTAIKEGCIVLVNSRTERRHSPKPLLSDSEDQPQQEVFTAPYMTAADYLTEIIQLCLKQRKHFVIVFSLGSKHYSV